MKHILIVEDDFALSDAFAIALRQEGYEVFIAQNGKKALEHLADNTPDLILLDVLMPVMDGKEFLRKYDNTARVPVVVLSNLDDKATIDELLSLGAQNYLLKSSVTPSTLASVVRGTMTPHAKDPHAPANA